MKQYLVFKLLLILVTFLVYGIISKLVFDNIYNTSKVVIDEAFHLPQGLQYCNFNFSTWNPKITTLPGLYLISTALFGPLNLCTIYTLRFTNLIASIINLGLIYIYIGLQEPRVQTIKRIILSLNLSFLPPLYFFSYLYYTDVLSLTFILLILIFSHKDQHLLSSIFGVAAVIVRQTNIIWLLMVFGKYTLKEIFTATVGSRNKYTLQDWKTLLKSARRILKLKDISYIAWLNIAAYGSVIILFTTFVYLNGSIVVGDKSAHVATIHIPQIFYFALFYLIFSWPTCIQTILPFLQYVKNNVLLLLVSLLGMLVIVHYNTQVHPYLLADNRHYTFYVWTRFYEKYIWFRYIITPVYIYGLFIIFRKLQVKCDVNFIFLYITCVILALVPQRLIEIRYFLIPYIIIRLESQTQSYKILFFELLYFIIINVVTLNIFLTKDIYWKDFDYVQKLIW